MAGIKPNMFPLKSTPLDGSEELYTQTGGTSEKFTTAELKTYVNSGTSAQVCEVIAYKVNPNASVPPGPAVNIGNFYIPYPNELHPAATKIEVKVILGVFIEFTGQDAEFELSNAFTGVFAADHKTATVDGWTDFIKSGWADPVYHGIEMSLTLKNNVLDPSDLLELLESSVILVRAIE